MLPGLSPKLQLLVMEREQAEMEPLPTKLLLLLDKGLAWKKEPPCMYSRASLGSRAAAAAAAVGSGPPPVPLVWEAGPLSGVNKVACWAVTSGSGSLCYVGGRGGGGQPVSWAAGRPGQVLFLGGDFRRF